MPRLLTMSSAIAILSAGAAADPRPPHGAAPELAEMGNAMAGAWSCKGQGLGRDMKLTEMTATSKWTIDVSGWWLHESFTGTVGKETPHVYEAYITYDPGAKKWRRVMVTGGGGWNTGETTSVTACGAAPNGCKLEWELSAHTMRGDFLFRDHVDATDVKAGVKGWGEMSLDKGKTWMKAYELTCKK